MHVYAKYKREWTPEFPKVFEEFNFTKNYHCNAPL